MKLIKFCSLILMLILSTGLISIKNDNIPLSQEELKYIFPDDNLRAVVKDYFPHEDITISKLNNLEGEFYASNEDIKDLTGISTLKSIDKFVFWNNEISSLPPEITTLNKIKYINLANNYLTEINTINTLIDKGVKIDYDLNFISDERYQYELSSKKRHIILDKNEKVNLRSLLKKTIDTYPKYWEVTNVLPSDIDLYIESNNPANMSVDNIKGTCTAGNRKGVYYIVISLNKDKLPNATTIIKASVK